MADKGIPFDVPTRANLLQGQRLIDEQLREKAARDAKLSPLDKAYAALEAARTFGSGILATVGSLPTRAIKGEDAAQEYINQRMYIPTTEKGMDYVGNVGNFLEQLETKYKLPPVLPEAVALQNVMGPAAKQATKQAAKAAKPVVGQALEDYMFKQGLAMPVVKPTGGNWLTGDVEGALNKLKGPTQPRYTHINDQGMAVGEGHGRPMTADEIQQSNADPTFIANQALNKWIDSNLTNYVKKQMATPDDPVRKLAEEGILHMAPYGEQGVVSSRLMNKRLGLGQNPLGLGRSDAARFWERMSDISVDAYPASSYKYGALDESILANNPWLQKVPDETMINSGKGLTGDLGFDHILDVLREDLAAGRIRPEQLNKVSMEQAVRRTHEYDQELASKMDAARAATREGLPVYKKYPEGFQWVELNKPGSFASESESMGHSVRGYEPPKGHSDWVEGSGNSGSSGYGHGGWEAIKSGKAKVYSLVDSKGEPHVTIETKTKGVLNDNDFGENDTRIVEGRGEFGEKGYKTSDNQFFESYADAVNHEKMIQKPTAEELKQPSSITQIKGKQNRAPKEEYLPFVQDFVRSGQWSDVGDLPNTGLIKNDGKYMTQGEYDDYLLNQLQPPPVEGMKRGGSVHIADNPDTMMMEVEDQKFVGGGIAKAAKTAAKSAVATRELEKQAVLRAEAAAKSAAKQALMPQYNEAVKGMTQKQDPLSFEQWKAINYPEGTQGLQDAPQKQTFKYPQESLPAAERDANLAKMLKDSKVKERLYHGTKAHDDYADEAGQAFTQFTGKPTWLAKEPYTASGYSGGTGSTYPVHAQVKKPLTLNFDANDEASNAFPIAERFGVDIDHMIRMRKPESAWEVINDPAFVDAVESAGYDGLMINEGGYKTYGVFSPNKIKSATGNRGTYDIEDADITKASGGSVNLDAMYMAVNDAKFRRK